MSNRFDKSASGIIISAGMAPITNCTFSQRCACTCGCDEETEDGSYVLCSRCMTGYRVRDEGHGPK